MSFELDPFGSYWMCCPQIMTESFARSSDGTLKEAWNSEKARRIRRSIHDNTFEYCIKHVCAAYIQGLKTKEYWSQHDAAYAKLIAERGEVVDTPKQFSLSYEGACNLACPSCRSTRWSVTTPQARQTHQDLMDWVFDKPHEKAFVLYTCGYGDPFHSKLIRDFLENLNGADFPNVKFTIQTNGLLLTPAQWAKLSKIHGNIIGVRISIDAATRETYAVVRGGDWDRLNENLKFISQIRKEGKIYFMVDWVAQQANFQEMPEGVNLAHNLSADAINFMMMTNWATSAEDFKQKNIFDPDHPDHELMREILKYPIFKDSIVNLGNLSQFLA